MENLTPDLRCLVSQSGALTLNDSTFISWEVPKDPHIRGIRFKDLVLITENVYLGHCYLYKHLRL